MPLSSMQLLLARTVPPVLYMCKRANSEYTAFREIFKNAKHIVALTGAGISAESGLPTFRGAGGLWRRYSAQDLATPTAFFQNPALIWEFYSYRRDLVLSKRPNLAHFALAEAEKRMAEQGRRLVVITQNIDELHKEAGTKNLLELHGTLFKTRCIKCGHLKENKESPICPALYGKGSPDPDAEDARIPEGDLPRCKKCSGLLRPHVVWFGESLDPDILNSAQKELENCDLCLVIGTSSVVYPAAMFAPAVAARGVPVAEFNIEATPGAENFGATAPFIRPFEMLSSQTAEQRGQSHPKILPQFYFEGPCGSTLPRLLRP